MIELLKQLDTKSPLGKEDRHLVFEQLMLQGEAEIVKRGGNVAKRYQPKTKTKRKALNMLSAALADPKHGDPALRFPLIAQGGETGLSEKSKLLWLHYRRRLTKSSRKNGKQR